jgi:hypothetical protein
MLTHLESLTDARDRHCLGIYNRDYMLGLRWKIHCLYDHRPDFRYELERVKHGRIINEL